MESFVAEVNEEQKMRKDLMSGGTQVKDYYGVNKYMAEQNKEASFLAKNPIEEANKEVKNALDKLPKPEMKHDQSSIN